MHVNVVFLPLDLSPADVRGRTVVVFDVLRATTSISTALQTGVQEIRVYSDVAAVRSAAQTTADALLCGEEKCHAPAGFHLGNSPIGFRDKALRGRTLLMSTTNGTRAILAAQGASLMLTAALVNATAAAKAAVESGLDVTLLCAGTDGRIAMEDLIGAGAVASAILAARPDCDLSDANKIALRLFESAKGDLRTALADSQGGRNVIAAGLGDDLAAAAALDALDAVGVVQPPTDPSQPPIIRRWPAPSR